MSEEVEVAFEPLRCAGKAPAARQSHTSTLVRPMNWMVVFGGCSHAVGERVLFNDTFRLALDTGEWTEIKTSGAIPCPRYKHCAVHIPRSKGDELGEGENGGGGRGPSPAAAGAGMLLVTGGSDGQRRLFDAFLLDLDVLSWTSVRLGAEDANIVPRACVSAKREIFIFGGSAQLSSGLSSWVLDLESGSAMVPVASVLGGRPAFRQYFSCVLYKNTVVLFGGYNGLVFGDVHVFSCDSRTWREVHPENAPPGRYRHSAAVVGRYMVVVGGTITGKKWLRDTLVLDLERWVWMETRLSGAEIPPRESHTSLCANNRLYVFGGYKFPKANNDVWMAQISHNDNIGSGPGETQGRRSSDQVGPSKDRAKYKGQMKYKDQESNIRKGKSVARTRNKAGTGKGNTDDNGRSTKSKMASKRARAGRGALPLLVKHGDAHGTLKTNSLSRIGDSSVESDVADAKGKGGKGGKGGKVSGGGSSRTRSSRADNLGRAALSYAKYKTRDSKKEMLLGRGRYATPAMTSVEEKIVEKKHMLQSLRANSKELEDSITLAKSTIVDLDAKIRELEPEVVGLREEHAAALRDVARSRSALAQETLLAEEGRRLLQSMYKKIDGARAELRSVRQERERSRETVHNLSTTVEDMRKELSTLVNDGSEDVAIDSKEIEKLTEQLGAQSERKKDLEIQWRIEREREVALQKELALVGLRQRNDTEDDDTIKL